MATPRQELRNYGSASGQQRRSRTVGLPDVDLRLGKSSAQYAPGEVFTCEYEIDLRSADPDENKAIIAIETSVLWMTEGKGDSDIGVHFFERREKKSVIPELLKQTHKLTAKLPLTPLSYDGSIVKVKWIARVRMFMQDGTEHSHDEVFRVGHATPLTNPPLGIVGNEEGG